MSGKSEIRNPKSEISNPQSLIPNPLFSVRTPTAVVTDLGTEFGVEVDNSGATLSHVFRGKVEVRPAGTGNSSSPQESGTERRNRAVQLGVGESARADIVGGIVKITRGVDARGVSSAAVFAQQMPQWRPIETFNTGIGVKVGDPDPHWQLVARSDDPHFKPKAAVVTSVIPTLYLSNEPSRSQWVSSSGLAPTPDAVYMPVLPVNVTYTFRTKFDLRDVSPASVVLRGRFLTDRRVTAIRLNGKAMPVPKQGKSVTFDHFDSFFVNEGFVKGSDMLEFDVFSGPSDPSVLPEQPNRPMALRVELQGQGLRRGQTSPATAGNAPGASGGKEVAK